LSVLQLPVLAVLDEMVLPNIDSVIELPTYMAPPWLDEYDNVLVYPLVIVKFLKVTSVPGLYI